MRPILFHVVVPFALGCSNVLGADFDGAQVTPEFELRVLTPAHPSDTNGATPKSTGAGAVSSPDGAIDCGPRCTARYNRQTLSLIAEPDEGSAFAGWRTEPSTPCSGTRAPECLLEIGENLIVEAYFVARGANLWFTSIGGPGADVAEAIAVDPSGRSYAAGEFAGSVSYEGHVWQSVDAMDAFLISSDADGKSVAAKLIQSPGEELITDLAAQATGVVVAGQVLCVTGSSDECNVIPFDWTLTGQHGFIAGFDSELSYQWSLPIEGVGASSMAKVVVDAGGRIFGAGTLDGTLSGDPLVIGPPQNDDDILFVSLESNGALRWVTELGGATDNERPAALAVQSTGTIVLAGNSGAGFDPNARGGGCSQPKAGSFIARFDESGICVDARNVSSLGGDGIVSIAVMSDDDLVLAGVTDPGVSVDLSEGTAASAIVGGGAHFVARLNESGGWELGKSWVQILDGSGKLPRVATLGDQVLISMSLLSDMFVGSETVSLVPGRAFYLLALDADGGYAWHRSWRGPPDGVFLDIAPHAPSNTWFVAGRAEDAESVFEIDFENVTQAPFVARSFDAVVARLAR